MAVNDASPSNGTAEGRWFAGTSGYSYKEWKGSFYPAELKPDEWLSYYARKLPSVEINNTFYRMPKTHVVEEWAASVPSSFRFVIKASRRITHQARLKDVDEPLDFLINRADILEDKLGAVLFQLPPYLKKDLQRLEMFLSIWPRTLPAAMEFRHDSWLVEEVFDLLNARDVALVITDDEESPAGKLPLTASWAYLRLRRPDYNTRQLGRWLKLLKGNDADGDNGTNPLKHGFAFFKHEDDGAGPALAQRFLNLAVKPAPKRAGPVRERQDRATKGSSNA